MQSDIVGTGVMPKSDCTPESYRSPLKRAQPVKDTLPSLSMTNTVFQDPSHNKVQKYTLCMSLW